MRDQLSLVTGTEEGTERLGDSDSPPAKNLHTTYSLWFSRIELTMCTCIFSAKVVWKFPLTTQCNFKRGFYLSTVPKSIRKKSPSASKSDPAFARVGFRNWSLLRSLQLMLFQSNYSFCSRREHCSFTTLLSCTQTTG